MSLLTSVQAALDQRDRNLQAKGKLKLSRELLGIGPAPRPTITGKVPPMSTPYNPESQSWRHDRLSEQNDPQIRRDMATFDYATKAKGAKRLARRGEAVEKSRHEAAMREIDAIFAAEKSADPFNVKHKVRRFLKHGDPYTLDDFYKDMEALFKGRQ